MPAFALRDRRKSLGLSLLEAAQAAGCTAEVVLHAEFGMDLPRDLRLRDRLASAYRISRVNYDRLAVRAARDFRERTLAPALT